MARKGDLMASAAPTTTSSTHRGIAAGSGGSVFAPQAKTEISAFAGMTAKRLERHFKNIARSRQVKQRGYHRDGKNSCSNKVGKSVRRTLKSDLYPPVM